MAINFPSNPTNGQTYTNPSTGVVYTFSNTNSLWLASTIPTSIPVTSVVVEYLIVGGGGSGANADSSVTPAGGGGAGGLLQGITLANTNISYDIVVGAGGVSGSADSIQTSNPGSYSKFGSILAVGGGGANRSVSNDSIFDCVGGSGGGARNTTFRGAPGIQGQGYKGGNHDVTMTGGFLSGGGGGAGNVGLDSANTFTGSNYRSGNGGVGIWSSISGSNTAYAGGGGGGARFTGSSLGTVYAGYGGQGGGGDGGVSTGGLNPATTNVNAKGFSSIPANSNTYASGVNGTINTGGGGGGSGGQGISGSGGSGVVILSYSTAYSNATVTGTPTYSEINNKRIFTFTGSGSITFN